MAGSQDAHWLDFSGAPPLLIPRSLALLWRGTADPSTGVHRELNTQQPVTDYDRACAAAWPGRNILDFKGVQILVLYTEFDRHNWDADRKIVACGGWFPSDDEAKGATWSDPVRWSAKHSHYLLMNSAVDASAGLREDDYLDVQLPPAIYTVEYADIESDYVGGFHRFTRDDRLEQSV